VAQPTTVAQTPCRKNAKAKDTEHFRTVNRRWFDGIATTQSARIYGSRGTPRLFHQKSSSSVVWGGAGAGSPSTTQRSLTHVPPKKTTLLLDGGVCCISFLCINKVDFGINLFFHAVRRWQKIPTAWVYIRIISKSKEESNDQLHEL
jgi:hypothetical protein